MCFSCSALGRRALLKGLLAVPLASCSDNVQTGRRQMAFVPDSQLVGLADQAWAEMLTKTPVSSSPAMVERLARVAARITGASTRDDLTWEFVVFDSPELNAFVLPNGKVAVFKGMMEFATTDDELGAVLGHEVAHVVARHPAERVSQQLAAEVGMTLAQMAFGGENGENAQLVAGIFGLGATYGVLLPYSRTHELEADRVGVELMKKAGMEPLAALRFWERMIERRETQGAPPEALSSHPADARRLNELRAVLGAAL